MANSSVHTTNRKLNPYSTQIKNEEMILNGIHSRSSIFFNQANEDGKVHVQIPRYIDAASNKTISMQNGVYIAQAFKNLGIETTRIITEKGAEKLGTSIKREGNVPHVDIKGSIKLSEKDKSALTLYNENLSKSRTEENKNVVDYKIAENHKAIDSGYKQIAFSYYPAYAVNDVNKLKDVFRQKNTPYYNRTALEKFENSNELKSNLYEEGQIDGNNAADWKEHIKNCMTGKEVILSKEKARDFYTSMENDIRNGIENGDNFIFSKAVTKASLDLANEIKHEKDISKEIDQSKNYAHPGVEDSREEEMCF